MRAAAQKCILASHELKFLGHIIDRTGPRPDPDKVKTIVEYPRPQTQTHILSFLGITNYYRKHVDHYSAIATPLTDLTKKNQLVIWTPEAEIAFNTLKEKLITPPTDITVSGLQKTLHRLHGLESSLRGSHPVPD